jgi:NADH dehydrogenase
MILAIVWIALVSLAVVGALVFSLLPPRAQPATTVEKSRPLRIAILGGGFGGVYAAQELEELIGERDDVEITLFNKENYFVFQPMLPEVISGSIGVFDTTVPLRHLLNHTQVQVRDIEAIDLQRRIISAAPGFHPHAHLIEYDHLVLANGTVTDFRGLPGLPEHAMPFKNLGDALAVRNHVIHALEEADIETDDEALRRQLLTFVVAGGGFSGVEVVAELNDFVRGIARRYPSIHDDEIRVVLVHSQNRILPEMSEKLGRFAQRILESRGVEMKLEVRLKAATAEGAILSDDSRIPTRTLISTIPSSPHPLIDALDLPKAKGRVKVDQFLRVEGTTNVWALGDCAQVIAADGAVCPPTAQFAVRQGRTLARNLVATSLGEEMAPLDFKGLGKMGSLGRRNAVAEIFGFGVSGFLAWFLWRTIYLLKLPGWGRRAKVAASWTFDLFLEHELVQLRISDGSGSRHAHYEAGEIVFEEGDLGDRVYVILRGRAEVLKRSAGELSQIAILGAGEVFGETAVLGTVTRNATIRCVEPMETLCIPKRDFNLLTSSLPELRKSFEGIAAKRGVA